MSRLVVLTDHGVTFVCFLPNAFAMEYGAGESDAAFASGRVRMSRSAVDTGWTRATSLSISIAPIKVGDVTDDLARESGFESVEDLLQIARHGSGRNAEPIRFHYLPEGAWDLPLLDQAPIAADHQPPSVKRWLFAGSEPISE